MASFGVVAGPAYADGPSSLEFSPTDVPKYVILAKSDYLKYAGSIKDSRNCMVDQYSNGATDVLSQ
jgi:hypothetical protein